MNEVKTVKLSNEVKSSLDYLYQKIFELKNKKRNSKNKTKTVIIHSISSNKLKKYKKSQIFQNLVNFINSSFTVLEQSIQQSKNTANTTNFKIHFQKVNVQNQNSLNKVCLIPFHKDDYNEIPRPVWTMIYILKKDPDVICNNLWYKINGILININLVPNECIIIPGNLYYGLDEIYGNGNLELLSIQFERIINV